MTETILAKDLKPGDKLHRQGEYELPADVLEVTQGDTRVYVTVRQFLRKWPNAPVLVTRQKSQPKEEPAS